MLFNLSKEYDEKCEIEKQKYFDNMVADLKTSNPGKWYSKLKRMSGQEKCKQENILVDELIGLSDQEQADCIADHYSAISNQYDQVKNEDFPQYFNPIRQGAPVPKIEPLKVYQTIMKMNKNAATVPNDIPIKLVAEFSVELAFPLAHIIDFCLERGVYPDRWKISFSSTQHFSS